MFTIIVPVYNEAATVDALLSRLLARVGAECEVLIVDDGSTDATPGILEHWREHPQIVLLRHAKNRGKGAAIRSALAHARGDITVIQDADLEYDPGDIRCLIEIVDSGQADAVYGSRYLENGKLPWSKFRVAVVCLNGLVRMLYGVRLTDEATCYKVMPTQLLRSLNLQAERFEFCPEVTAKLCRRGIRIREVPISYQPRSDDAGKKIGWRDVWPTVWTLVKWRFLS